MLRIPKGFADAIIEHARADHPNEACGLLAGSNGAALKHYPMTNAERSPVIYRMEPAEQLKVFNDIEADGLGPRRHLPLAHALAGVSVGYRRVAGVLPRGDLPHRVAGRHRRPDLRGFRITDGKVDEIELEFT